MKKPERLQKYISQCGVASRRGAEELIREGRVTVNGRDAKAGKQIDVGDEVTIEFGSGILKFRILKVCETISKDDASTMYEVLEG